MQYFSENADELKKGDALAMEVELVWRDLSLPASMKDFPERFPGRCGNKRDPFHLYFISESKSPFALWAQCHGHIDSGNLVFFQVNLSRKPKEKNPPQNWLRISDELGGYPDGLTAILTSLSDVGRVGCEVELDLFYQKSPFRVSPRKFKQEIQPFRAESQSLSLVGPDDTEVDLYFNPKGGIIVNIEAKIEMPIDQDCFETACAELKERLSPLLREQK